MSLFSVVSFRTRFSNLFPLRLPHWSSISTVQWIIAGGIVLLCAAGVSIGRYCIIPDVAYLRNHNPAVTSFMKFREEQWRKQGRMRHVVTKWVPLNRISPHLVQAVVVSEDAKFWHHHGFDFAAMRYAAQENFDAKKMKFGASTISQQLVKNLYLRPSKNFFRKSAEAILTWRMEHTLSKSRIIEIYLNVIEWGDGIFGIEQAARYYYGKPAADLTAGEAARLAVVLPNPRRLNPLSEGKYVEKRSDIIIRRMQPGFIPKQQDITDSVIVDVNVSAQPAEPADSLPADSGVIDSQLPAAGDDVGDSGAAAGPVD